MNELEQLKAKYQELGAVIERMEKGEAEFKPLAEGFYVGGNGCTDEEPTANRGKLWNIMPTIKEAERLGKIFQAVAEQEHLVKFVNGGWEWDKKSLCCTLHELQGELTIQDWRFTFLLGSAPMFKNYVFAERALKLASPNLLAYWNGEL